MEVRYEKNGGGGEIGKGRRRKRVGRVSQKLGMAEIEKRVRSGEVRKNENGGGGTS